MATRISYDSYDRALYTLAMSLRPLISIVNGKPVVRLSRSANEILLFDEYDMNYFVVRDIRGNIIAGNEDIPLPRKWDASASNHRFYDGLIDNKRVRIVAVRVAVPAGSRDQPIFIEAAETTVKRKMLARDITSNILVPQILIIIISTTVVWFGVGKGLAPLRKLQAAISNRSHLDLSPIEDSGIPDEVSPLVFSINDLMRRLQMVIDAQNRFIADAAHQLRTPLAGLLAQIAYALRQNDTETLKHCMDKLYISAGRVSRLVNQLLALARNEPGTDKAPVKDRVDINQLTSDVVMEWVPEALKKDVDLGFEGGGCAINIVGDEQRLKEMLANVLDNAIRYTQSAGYVTVKVLNKETPTLVFEDNGTGIPPDELELVFQRFYRVTGNGSDGSGLGLAIVRDIASAHNADVSIESNPAGRGVIVKIVFRQGSA